MRHHPSIIGKLGKIEEPYIAGQTSHSPNTKAALLLTPVCAFSLSSTFPVFSVRAAVAIASRASFGKLSSHRLCRRFVNAKARSKSRKFVTSANKSFH